jgi:hypothetical protein
MAIKQRARIFIVQFFSLVLQTPRIAFFDILEIPQYFLHILRQVESRIIANHKLR